MPRFAAFLLLVSLVLPGAARAEWMARCTGGAVAACYGEACGATREEARSRCLEVCPGGDTHSVGTSSCSVPRPTQTPKTKAPASNTPAQ